VLESVLGASPREFESRILRSADQARCRTAPPRSSPTFGCPTIGSDAIEVSLEHVEGQALRIQLPYAKQRKDISYGPIRASTGSRRIWAYS
jgi:hypothetical protein